MTRLDLFREFGSDVGSSLYHFASNHCAYRYHAKINDSVEVERKGTTFTRRRSRVVIGFYPDELLRLLEEVYPKNQGVHRRTESSWGNHYGRIKERLGEITKGTDYPLQRDIGGEK